MRSFTVLMHGYIPPHRFLPYLSWTEVDALPDKANTVIVLPVGSVDSVGVDPPVDGTVLWGAAVVVAASFSVVQAASERRASEATTTKFLRIAEI